MALKDLERAFEQVKTLSGILPMCSHCKKIRDDAGYWQLVENYLEQHSEAQFSHSLCPDCVKHLYPDMAESILKKVRDREMSKLKS